MSWCAAARRSFQADRSFATASSISSLPERLELFDNKTHIWVYNQGEILILSRQAEGSAPYFLAH